jgi:hypothetical protein
VGFVVDKAALQQVFSEYFGFPCQLSFHRLLHTHHLSAGAGKISQLVTDVPSGLSLTPSQGNKNEKEFEPRSQCPYVFSTATLSGTPNAHTLYERVIQLHFLLQGDSLLRALAASDEHNATHD